MVGPPTSPANMSSASDTEASTATVAGSDIEKACCCDSCIERRFVCRFFTVCMLPRLYHYVFKILLNCDVFYLYD